MIYMNESDYTYCSRCGSPMPKNARYCMKCGNLNYNHPDNQAMQKYAPEEAKTYEIGSGQINTNTTFTANISEYSTNTGSKKTFLVVNILWFLLTYGICFTLGILHIVNFFLVFVSFIILSIFNIYFISLEIINMKANKPWWGAVLPIYNMFILADIAFDKIIYVVFFFIPIVNVIFSFILFYQLGKKFNKNPILTMLFNIFMLPIIAFGTSTYKGINYIDLKDKNAIEKDYRSRKKMFLIILLFLIIGLGGVVYEFISSGKFSLSKAEDIVIVDNAKSVLNKVKGKISKGKFSCHGDTTLTPNTTHYFMIYDITGDLNVLTFDSKIVMASVKVFNNNGTLEYSVSISNGQRGLFEIRENELAIDKIINYEKIADVDTDKMCYIE